MSIVNKIKRLSNLNNLTGEDIGDKLNCTWRTVVNIAQESGIEMSTRYNRAGSCEVSDEGNQNKVKRRWPQFYGDSHE